MLFLFVTLAAMCCIGLVWGLAALPAQERYFATVLSYQAEPRRPKTSHTFAVFTRARGDEQPHDDIEHHTISWLPTKLKIKMTKFWPQSGHNLDLHTTLELARTSNLRVSTWGPYPTSRELFDLALQRIAHLRSGKMKFIVIDTVFRLWKVAVNCIHAVSDLDPMERGLITGTAHGDAATQLVVDHLRPWFLESTEDTAWLRLHLGLHNSVVCI